MSMTFANLPPFGTKSPANSRLPVSVLNEPQNRGALLYNCYIQEILGPRISGRLLNIGAGTASAKFQHQRMIAASEYHTLEPADAGIPCTYICSATKMDPVPSESYDWVMSVAVLEHVDDPWAAAREHVRALKSGGYLYVSIPFQQVMHPASSFGDYWRFTPQGLQKLFECCRLVETEIWGDDPSNPNGFAVLMQKVSPGTVPHVSTPVYWIDFPNAEPFELFVPRVQPTRDWPVRLLKSEPMHTAMELNRVRDEIYAKVGFTVTNREVARRFIDDYSAPFGSLGCKDGISYFTSAAQQGRN